MELPGALPISSPHKKKTPALFGLNPQNFFLKKILIFYKKPALKRFLIFSQKKAFLIFPKREHCTFQPELEK